MQLTKLRYAFLQLPSFPPASRPQAKLWGVRSVDLDVTFSEGDTLGVAFNRTVFPPQLRFFRNSKEITTAQRTCRGLRGDVFVALAVDGVEEMLDNPMVLSGRAGDGARGDSTSKGSEGPAHILFNPNGDARGAPPMRTKIPPGYDALVVATVALGDDNVV